MFGVKMVRIDSVRPKSTFDVYGLLSIGRYNRMGKRLAILMSFAGVDLRASRLTTSIAPYCVFTTNLRLGTLIHMQ